MFKKISTLLMLTATLITSVALGMEKDNQTKNKTPEKNLSAEQKKVLAHSTLLKQVQQPQNPQQKLAQHIEELIVLQ